MLKNTLLPKLEYDIALLLIQKACLLEINEEETVDIANKLLRVIPENMTDEQLEIILPELKNIYSGFEPITIKFLNMIHEEKANK